MRTASLLATLSTLLLACGGDDPPGTQGVGGTGGSGGGAALCTPGQQVACACPEGGAGAQVCRADGSGYDACQGCDGAGGAGGQGGAGGSGGAGGAGGAGGSPCVPAATCADQAQGLCGDVDDGCGTLLDCSASCGNPNTMSCDEQGFCHCLYENDLPSDQSCQQVYPGTKGYNCFGAAANKIPPQCESLNGSVLRYCCLTP